MKTKFSKIIKDICKALIPNKFDIGAGVLFMIMVVLALYLLDTYFSPGFTSKINIFFIWKVFFISLIALFILGILFSYYSDKYTTPTDSDAMTTNEDFSFKIFKSALSIFRWLILPIIIGIILQTFSHKSDSIKDEDIKLVGIDESYANSIPDISILPIETKLSWLRRARLRLVVHNGSKKTLKNGILHLSLPEGCRVTGGWSWISTSKSSVYTNFININPNTNLILLPLELEFLESKTYEFGYSIGGEDFRTPHRKMLIKVMQK